MIPPDFLKLSELCLDIVKKEPIVAVIQGRNQEVYPSEVFSHIFDSMIYSRIPFDWEIYLYRKNIASMTSLVVNLRRNGIQEIAEKYHHVNPSNISLICFDFNDFFIKSASSFSHSFNLLRRMSEKLKNLKHLIIKCEYKSRYSSIIADFYRIFKSILSNNNELSSVIIHQKCDKSDYFDALTQERAFGNFMETLPPSIRSLAIVRHGHVPYSPALFTNISLKCANLNHLSMHGMLNSYDHSHTDFDFTCLFNLRHLKYLDISIDMRPQRDDGITQCLSHQTELINSFLRSLKNTRAIELDVLDISGFTTIEKDLLKQLISEYDCLKSLRLCNTHYRIAEDKSYRVPLKLEVIEAIGMEGIYKCLKLYHHCPVYTKSVLLSLFNTTPIKGDLLPEIFQILLSLLEQYDDNAEICLAATACIFNVIEKMKALHIPLIGVEKMINKVVEIIDRFTDHNQLVRNCLVLVCKENIFKKEKFNAKLTISCCFNIISMHHCNVDDACVRMACLLICSLAAKLETRDAPDVTSSINLSQLLNMIELKIQSCSDDPLLTHCLASIWNLTDDCPCISSRFLQLGGIDIPIRIFSVFETVNDLQTKALGILNNISEVPQLRPYLLRHEVVECLIKRVETFALPCAFFAAGTLSNLLIPWNMYPDIIPSIQVDKAKDCLKNAVDNFGLSNTADIVVYRSFDPFSSLLSCDIPEVQWWSTWAIRHVTRRFPEKYILILRKKQLLDIIKNNLYHSWENIRLASSDILGYLS